MVFYRRIRKTVPTPKPTIQTYKTEGSLSPYAETIVSPVGAKTISYNADSYSKIYNFPASTAKPVIAVISLGGGLYGSINKLTGILTGGDCQTYWSSIGIPAAQQSTVIVIPVAGATNTPNAADGGHTEENCLDVQILGSNCPGSTILVFLAPLTYDGFYQAFKSAVDGNIAIIGGRRVSPSVISCSWGGIEKSWSPYDLNRFNALFGVAAAKGINICCATGDSGSSNGGVGNNVDFPSCSPNVIACGGTTLTCPSLKYDATTTEVAWSAGGGGVSNVFAAASCQVTALKATKRRVPDIALNADPKTGINIMVNGQIKVVGGTSAVAPAVSAFIGRAGITKFLPPSLYTIRYPTRCFHDVKAGSNGAFTAVAGYDYCTGLGSIDGSAISANL